MTERLFRCAFTWAELGELIRALDLIQQEDEACNVNMSAQEVADKNSAMKKLRRHYGRSPMEKLMDSSESIPVSDVRGEDRAFGKPPKERT